MRAAGYRVVELAVTDPRPLDYDSLGALLDRYGLQLVAFTTGQAAGKEGLSLSSPDLRVREEAVFRIQAHARVAKKFKAIVIIGLLRGKSGNLSLFYESLQECVRANPDVRFALEPLNRYETELINSVAEALALVERVGANNLGILFDTFHGNIEERSVPEALRLCGERLFHVHLADSNRWIPGFGHFPFAELWETLEHVGYKGSLILECLPRPDPMWLLSEEEVRKRVGLL
ncbi:MAG: sugar phosphate isomerase/epimerase family protein [Candidatus Bipolaricaulaceae bacterium]